MINAQSQRGFTLVEMLIAVFIALIIFGVGFVTISGTMRARAETAARIHSTEHARHFFQALEKDFGAAYPTDNIDTKTALVSATADQLILGKRISGGVETAFKIASDFMQFYTRADHPANEHEVLGVRYYVNFKQQVVREVLVGPTTPITDPANIDDAQHKSDANAMFDRVHSLQITYHQWDDINKKFVPPVETVTGAPIVDREIATHIRVRLIMFDTLNTITGTTGGTGIQTMDADVLTDPFDTSRIPSAASMRVFTRVIPIPNSFAVP